MNIPRSGLSVILAAALMHPAAFGADEATDAMQAAYASYRAALFRTNSNAQAESEQAMANTRKAWADILQRYGSKAPVPYDRDPQFRTALLNVDGVFARSQALVQSGKLNDAHAALEEARDLLADLRARNGVITFSDHMNEYHAAMEAVLENGTSLLEQPSGMYTLIERTGVLSYLATRLRQAAPANLVKDADFMAMHKAVEASVETLRGTLARQDAAGARKAIDGLKAPYSKMFLKYG